MNEEKEIPFINLNNYEIHPTQSRYMVFFFKEKKAADFFESELKKGGFYYEKDQADHHRKKFLFGVKRRDFRKIEEINNLTQGHHRQRTIPNRTFGKLVLFMILGIIGLSIVGYFMSQN